jgi:release factor glutamine methyltransferase
MQTLDVLRRAAGFLADRGVENARLDAEVLLADVLGVDRVGVYLSFDRPLATGEVDRYRDLVRRRGRREPLQHLRARQEFFSRDFTVDRRVLVPRPETETLVEAVIEIAGRLAAPRLLDVGTGSGVIAVTLALELAGATVSATDSSAEALELARGNATRLNALVAFGIGDLVEPFAGERFDVVVSNPPYVPTAEIERLTPEVREFEPRAALDGGEDGLHVIRRLVAAAPSVLADGGWLLVEIGAGQRRAVEEMLRESGLEVGDVRRDLAGIERVVGGAWTRS